jgi:glycosyltransferase involved in cell wall biosynthesis
LHYFYESKLGLSNSRNTGWRNARGKYIAYIDDDAIAPDNWLNKIIEVFETTKPKPSCVGGRVVPIWEATRPSWFSDALLDVLTVLDWSDDPHFLDDVSSQWLAGTNIAFSAEVLKRFGGLNTSLGRMGDNLTSGEEVFLTKLMIKDGYYCFYHPEIVVKHHILKSRLRKSWFVKRYYWQGVSDAAMQLIEEAPSELKRIRLAFSYVFSLLRSPRKLISLITPTNNPKLFKEKCFTLIEIGHIAGLFGVAKNKKCIYM